MLACERRATTALQKKKNEKKKGKKECMIQYRNLRPTRYYSAQGAPPSLKKKKCALITYREHTADKAELSKRLTSPTKY